VLGRYAPGTRRASGPVPVIADVGQKKTTLCEELSLASALTFGIQTIGAGDFLA